VEISERPPKPSGETSWRPWMLAVAGVAAFVLLLFRTSLLPGQVPGGVDTFTHTLPGHAFNARAYARGELPLWNPHVLCGHPHAAGAATSSFYPMSALFAVLPLSLAYSWSLLISLLLAGLAAYALARRWGHPPAAGMVAGLVYSSGGMTVPRIYAGHIAGVWSFLFLPLVILMVDRLFDGKRPLLDTGLLGLALGGAVVVGNPPGTIVILVGGVSYAIWRIGAALWLRLAGETTAWAGSEAKRQLPRTIGLGLAAGLVGLLVSACLVLTTSGTLAESARGSGLGTKLANAYSFPPESLLTLVSPRILGDPADVVGRHGISTYWGRSFFWEACCYVGVCALALAVYGAVRRARSGRTRFLLFASVLALAVGLGEHLGLTTIIFDLLPFATAMRCPNRMVLLMQLAVAMLACQGVTELAKDTVREEARPLLRGFRSSLPGVAMLLAAAALFLRMLTYRGTAFQAIIRWCFENSRYRFSSTGLTEQHVLNAHSATVGALVVAAVLAALVAGLFWSGRIPKLRGRIGAVAVAAVMIDLAWTMGGFIQPTATQEYGWPRGIAEAVRSPEGGRSRVAMVGNIYNLNIGSYLQIDTVNGYDQLITQRLSDLGFMMADKPKGPPYALYRIQRYHPALNLMAADYVLAKRGAPLAAEHLQEVAASGNLQLLHNPRAVPRALLVHRAKRVRTTAEARDAFFQRRFDPAREAIIETEPPPFDPPGPGKEYARIVSYEPHRVEISCAAAGRGLLILCDSYSSGWRATVDGVEEPVLRANFIFRGVPVDGGEHAVVFEYRPAGPRLGIILTALGLLSAMALILAGKFRQRARPQAC